MGLFYTNEKEAFHEKLVVTQLIKKLLILWNPRSQNPFTGP